MNTLSYPRNLEILNCKPFEIQKLLERWWKKELKDMIWNLQEVSLSNFLFIFQFFII